MTFIDSGVYKYAIVIDVVYIFIHLMLSHEMGVLISNTLVHLQENATIYLRDLMFLIKTTMYDALLK